jgi:hypothetical protein
MIFTSVVISVSVMAIMILMGAFIEFRLKTPQATKAMMAFILINIAVPSVSLRSIFNSDVTPDKLPVFGLIYLSSIAFNASGVFIAYTIARTMGWKGMNARLMAAMGGLGNTAFVGIPLCASVFGPTGGLYASIYDAGLTTSLFSFGILIMQKEKAFTVRSLRNIVNPPIIAIVTGLTLSLSGFHPPAVIMKLLDNLASLAAPLAMIYIGLLIPNILKVFRENNYLRQTWIPVSTKLLLMPLFALLVVQLYPVESMVKLVIVMQAGSPVFLLAPVLFARHGHDPNYGSIGIIYSTFAYLLTIPFVAWLAGKVLQ